MQGIRSIFSVIREADLLVHHPYQSFSSSTQRLVEEAARDPDVVAIKVRTPRLTGESLLSLPWHVSLFRCTAGIPDMGQSACR